MRMEGVEKDERKGESWVGVEEVGKRTRFNSICECEVFFPPFEHCFSPFPSHLSFCCHCTTSAPPLKPRHL